MTPGQIVEVGGAGFASGAQVALTLDSTPVDLGSFSAGASGRLLAEVEIPLDAEAGRHTLKAAGVGDDGQRLVLSASITIADAAGPGAQRQDRVPTHTGPSIVLYLVGVGGGLFLSGTFLRQVVRRRGGIQARR